MENDFITFSVRRGDKTIEGFDFVTPERYLESAEKAIETKFDGKVPDIFVATDDCSIIEDFRSLRPRWTFLSECDKMRRAKANKEDSKSGYVLEDMADWDLETTDAHYAKFFTELFALATSKYYIGVAYTNVAWWAYFMRNDRESYELIDREEPTAITLDAW